MEQQGIITPDQVRFGVKASKVLWDENWKIDPRDETENTIEREGISLERYLSYDTEHTPPEDVPYTLKTTHKTTQSVELVVAFTPRGLPDEKNALEIIDFLHEKANSLEDNHIPASWEFPDTRTTLVLKDLAEQDRGKDIRRFEEARANIFRRTGHQEHLLVARQRKKFKQHWSSRLIEINEVLASYLAEFDVLP